MWIWIISAVEEGNIFRSLCVRVQLSVATRESDSERLIIEVYKSVRQTTGERLVTGNGAGCGKGQKSTRHKLFFLILVAFFFLVRFQNFVSVCASNLLRFSNFAGVFLLVRRFFSPFSPGYDYLLLKLLLEPLIIWTLIWTFGVFGDAHLMSYFMRWRHIFIILFLS